MNLNAHRCGDAIAAVSSTPGRSHRGLIRVSGDDARHIMGALLEQPSQTIPARRLTRVELKAPSMPALMTVFEGPGSYTGQDVVELWAPGNAALLDRLLHQMLDAGARLAEPGEFTFRAFLAGKLDLTQAEGVAATISATSDSQLKAAKHLCDGELGRFARELVDDLGSHLAMVEAGIDFTDQEDVVPIGPGELDEHLARIQARLDDLLTHSRSWAQVDALPWVVLVGAPSSGKSTLFNALLKRQRAVIHPIAGTTRDVLCEPMTICSGKGVPSELMLVDIAGLDDPASVLDKQIQAAARRAIDRADLVLRVIDPTTHRAPQPAADLPQASAVLTVHAKADLPPNASVDPTDPGTLIVSATTGQGLDALRTAIIERLGERVVNVSADMLTLQPRHESALNSAGSHLKQARSLLSDQRDARQLIDVELIACHLRGALDDLAGLGGQLTPDDVIGRVFATFCVGK